MNAQCPHKWWSTLKSAVFGSGSDSYLPPLIGVGASLVCESVVKADMLSAHFDRKQSRDQVDLPSTCHPSPSLTTFNFSSWEVKRLRLDLDSMVKPGFQWNIQWTWIPGLMDLDSNETLGMFHLFFKRSAEVLANRLAVVFRRLHRLGSFRVCWRAANVTRISKGPPSSSASNYKPISLIPTYTVQGFWASGVGSFWAFYGMQRCASNHPVRL